MPRFGGVARHRWALALTAGSALLLLAGAAWAATDRGGHSSAHGQASRAPAALDGPLGGAGLVVTVRIQADGSTTVTEQVRRRDLRGSTVILAEPATITGAGIPSGTTLRPRVSEVRVSAAGRPAAVRRLSALRWSVTLPARTSARSLVSVTYRVDGAVVRSAPPAPTGRATVALAPLLGAAVRPAATLVEVDEANAAVRVLGLTCPRAVAARMVCGRMAAAGRWSAQFDAAHAAEADLVTAQVDLTG